VVDKIHWIIIAIIISVAGTYGDLVESMLKRSTGVKDSGTIMPGHGGFLDRFDSALISFPVVYLFISLVG
jgi:phosphatidate cytidylyltransferase